MSDETRKKVAKELIQSGEMMLKDTFLESGGWKHYDVPPIKKTVRSRIRLLIKRLAAGEDHYLSGFPKITRKEVKEIETLFRNHGFVGCMLQEESSLGAQGGTKIIYPTHRGEFQKAAVFLEFYP